MKPRGRALVTGASRGIGRSVALELAARGFDVSAGVRDLRVATGLEEEAARLRGTVDVIRLDVTKVSHFRPPPDLRVLVNNAGYSPPHVPVENTSEAELRKVFETNFFGPVEL